MCILEWCLNLEKKTDYSLKRDILLSFSLIISRIVCFAMYIHIVWVGVCRSCIYLIVHIYLKEAIIFYYHEAFLSPLESIQHFASMLHVSGEWNISTKVAVWTLICTLILTLNIAGAIQIYLMPISPNFFVHTALLFSMLWILRICLYPFSSPSMLIMLNALWLFVLFYLWCCIAVIESASLFKLMRPVCCIMHTLWF